MGGGLRQLEKNQTACNSKYNIVGRYLRSGEGASIKQLVPAKEYDCIVADCEGCLTGEYSKNPDLFDAVKMIQVERDDKRGDYSILLRDTLGMNLAHTGIGCDGACVTEVWTRA
jgi:hypothetical protein